MNQTRRLKKALKATTALTALPLALISITHNGFANPKGGKVVGGQAQISEPDASTLHVHQSTEKAIIDWQSFNIGVNETTQFFQPGTNSITLNRVVGSQDPSRILGTLKANGTVMVVNPDGVLFGPNSKIDVGGLVATTHDISNEDFMQGRYQFNIPGNPGASVVNLGDISIADYGIGAFVAPGVRNNGVITARLGSVGLSAANGFTLDMYGDGLIHLDLTDELSGEVIDVATGKALADRVKNEGTIKADGGIVALTAATARKVVNSVVNNTGVIEANTVAKRGGKIVLGAPTKKTKQAKAPAQIVKASGTLKASGTKAAEKGGKVKITGEVIYLDTIVINTDGDAGGGTVLVGGDYKGGNADANALARYGIKLEDEPVPTATNVDLSENVSISANATKNGDGGKVIVWSDDSTHTDAVISARGGQDGGDGGFIETSGAITLDVTKAADASSPLGDAGWWLLDPENVLFTEDTLITTFPGFLTFSIVRPSLVQSALNNGTNQSIEADRDIASDSSGSVAMDANSPFAPTLSLTAGGHLDLSNLPITTRGDVVLEGNRITANGITSNSGKFNLGPGGFTLDPLPTNSLIIRLTGDTVPYSGGFGNGRSRISSTDGFATYRIERGDNIRGRLSLAISFGGSSGAQITLDPENVVIGKAVHAGEFLGNFPDASYECVIAVCGLPGTFVGNEFQPFDFFPSLGFSRERGFGGLAFDDGALLGFTAKFQIDANGGGLRFDTANPFHRGNDGTLVEFQNVANLNGDPSADPSTFPYNGNGTRFTGNGTVRFVNFGGDGSAGSNNTDDNFDEEISSGDENGGSGVGVGDDEIPGQEIGWFRQRHHVAVEYVKDNQKVKDEISSLMYKGALYSSLDPASASAASKALTYIMGSIKVEELYSEKNYYLMSLKLVEMISQAILDVFGAGGVSMLIKLPAAIATAYLYGFFSGT